MPTPERRIGIAGARPNSRLWRRRLESSVAKGSMTAGSRGVVTSGISPHGAHKIALIGAGQIGGTLAHLVGLKELGDVVSVRHR